MNLQQLAYIVAIDNVRHFGKAAEASNVTQPTLSMMVQKLEEELGVRIFDRSKQPVVPTPEGREVIKQARKILAEADALSGIALTLKGEIKGHLKIGIIPTLAPYLLPRFVKTFSKKYPGVQLSVSELLTDHIVQALKNGQLDAGILATPLNDAAITETPLFYESFYVFASTHEPMYGKAYVMPEHIRPDRLWLLEEGHCLRAQMLKLCEFREASVTGHLDYQTGSIETLIRLVEQYEGLTIVPALSVVDMTEERQRHIVPFARPYPQREISLVTYRSNYKKGLLHRLEKAIKNAVPPEMLHPEGTAFSPV